ncbi:MAG: polysaccharide deacetylase family protein [Fibrobacter sp.]|nr:polysaccharide deacetylase family protein [Fibrobacter sp.]
MSRKFLLCFHDFSVWNYQKVVPILEDLKDLVRSPFSVLVIPDTENATADAVQGFREALMRLKSDGFELALHGFKHKAEFSQGRSYAGLVGMNMTSGEAEFAGLSQYESSRLLQAALGAWNTLFAEENGKADAPVAFIPPTWFSNKYLPGQVRAEKMLYEDRFSVTTADGVRYASPVASFAGIPKATEKAAIAYAALIMKLPVGLPRLAVHPVDFPRMRDVIRDTIRVALGNRRKLVRYGDL